MIKKLILGTMQTNCYVVYNEQHECFLIDPGAQGQKIVRFLEEKELKLKAILLTHGHFDHIGAVDYLYDRFHCPIYTQKESFEIIQQPQMNLSAMMGEPFVLKSPIMASQPTMQIAGMTIQWLLLEGHCYGSSMIYVPQENALFSGDVLFAGSIGRYDFPTSSHLTTKESLKKIKTLQFDARLLPGHGVESSLKYEQMHNPFLRS
ncbi:MBL fold metallo-hydrolase [Allocoprobacillus halotolerans]|uniref:MBL fold metallo-hydrolase n=1 Tax=Allocoprobacillus halotolerans TaxID=2944914 RepID=A0ABY5I2X0_9FIRM|nr:MBL fold metallo-hydrolase [Allocoprobacillus halotolerans]UTY38729.1 MBL fold metallo-hydrolase [Allocoprobacillus halotolerans]